MAVPVVVPLHRPTATPGLAVQRALSALWGPTTMPALLEHACVQACAHFGVERAWLARVDGETLVVAAVHVDPADAADLTRRALIGRRMRIPAGSPESEALRRRQAVLVEATSIVAPVAVDERTVGLLCVERAWDPPLGEDERAALSAFAEGLAFAAERVALLERLRAQRRYVTEMAVSAQAVTTELCTAPIDPLSPDTDTMAVMAGNVAVTAAPPGEARPLLSRRERDVMELLAHGATNAAIAERLCLSHDTVKTHVRRILRKLRAANRAEAVSRYLRFT